MLAQALPVIAQLSTSIAVSSHFMYPHLQALLFQDIEIIAQAVWALGNIAGDSPTCRDLVLNSGALQPLLAQLDNSKLSMQRNATWTLSNFCRGKPQPDFNLVLPCLPRFYLLLAHQSCQLHWCSALLLDAILFGSLETFSASTSFCCTPCMHFTQPLWPHCDRVHRVSICRRNRRSLCFRR